MLDFLSESAAVVTQGSVQQVKGSFKQQQQPQKD